MVNNNESRKEPDILLRCSERRLGKIYINWMKKNFIGIRSPYLIYIPGSIFDFIHGSEEIQKHSWEWIAEFVEQGARRIYVCIHEDCLIFNKSKFDPTKEGQCKDAKEFKRQCNERHPEVEVIIIYANLANKKEEKFDLEIIE